MATVCDFDSKPVLFAFRDLMDRSQVTQSERKDLEATVLSFLGEGFRDQSKPGSMPCPQVRARMDRTIGILRSPR